MLVRRDIWTLTGPGGWHPIVLAYAKAVRVMQREYPANDPRNWVNQAARHASATPFTPGGQQQQCQHRSWFFLPWHRMYLFYFEAILRDTMSRPDVQGPADFALPYWNYDRGGNTNTLPFPFRQPTLPDGTQNPLFVAPPNRPKALNDGAGLPARVTSWQTAKETASFAATGINNTIPGFGGGTPGRFHQGGQFGAVELTPHGSVHSIIGGFMGLPELAALDPIFWLHHANIDRLWNRWIDLQTSTGNSTGNTWRDETFQFFDENQELKTKRVKDVTNARTQLNYRYDDDPEVEPTTTTPSPGADATPDAAPVELTQLVGASETSLRLQGERASVQVVVPRETEAVADNAGGAPESAAIQVENVTAERNPALVYAIYLTVPGAEGEDEQRAYVGNLSLFGIEQWNDLNREEHGTGGLTLTYDASNAIAEMRSRGLWRTNAVTVTFEPLTLVPPADQPDQPEADATPAPTEPIDIGRVSLLAR